MKQLEKCSGRGFDSRHLHLIVFGYIVQVGHTNSEFVKCEVDSRYIHHFGERTISWGCTGFRQGNKYRSGQLVREDIKTK